MSDQQENESLEVVATGSTSEGRIHVEASLGAAKVQLDWDANEDEHIDALVASIYQITEAVLARLGEEQEADRG